MTRALVLIDLQLDYFAGGAHPLVGPDAAVANAAVVLEQLRASGEPVIHVFEIWDEPEATFFRPGTPGVEIHPAVAPRAGERVVQKSNANAFLDTSLEAALRALGADEVVVVGMMTCVCIDSSVRAAADLGFDVTVVGDLCGARSRVRRNDRSGSPGSRRLPRGAGRELRDGGHRRGAVR